MLLFRCLNGLKRCDRFILIGEEQVLPLFFFMITEEGFFIL